MIHLLGVTTGFNWLKKIRGSGLKSRLTLLVSDVFKVIGVSQACLKAKS